LDQNVTVTEYLNATCPDDDTYSECQAQSKMAFVKAKAEVELRMQLDKGNKQGAMQYIAGSAQMMNAAAAAPSSDSAAAVTAASLLLSTEGAGASEAALAKAALRADILSKTREASVGSAGDLGALAQQADSASQLTSASSELSNDTLANAFDFLGSMAAESQASPEQLPMSTGKKMFAGLSNLVSATAPKLSPTNCTNITDAAGNIVPDPSCLDPAAAYAANLTEADKRLAAERAKNASKAVKAMQASLVRENVNGEEAAIVTSATMNSSSQRNDAV
jgi:hypothetical protein